MPKEDQAGWEAFSRASEHEHIPGGCVGCHGGAALGSAGNGPVDHSFRADERVCGMCHLPGVMQSSREAASAMTERALQLSAALARRCGPFATTRSPHPSLDELARCEPPSLRRAQYELALIREDPAALYHNASLSRALLEDAARLIQRESAR